MCLGSSVGRSCDILAKESIQQFAGVEQMLGHEQLRLCHVASSDGVEQCGVFAVVLIVWVLYAFKMGFEWRRQESNGFNDKTWLNGQGIPHSEDLHVIERYRRPDLGHLEIEITLEDPKAFTKPHTFKRTYTLLPKWEIHEYVCNEFNIDAEHLVGK